MESEKEIGSVLYIIDESSVTAESASASTGEYTSQIISIAAIPTTVTPASLPVEQSLRQPVPNVANVVTSIDRPVPVKKACKHCSSANIERRRRAGWEKVVLPLVKTYRYICYSCGRDFYAKRAA